MQTKTDIISDHFRSALGTCGEINGEITTKTKNASTKNAASAPQRRIWSLVAQDLHAGTFTEKRLPNHQKSAVHHPI